MSKNRIVRTVERKTIFPSAKALVDSTSDWNQGDLLVFNDTTNKIVKPTSEAQGATFLGIAEQSVVDGKLLSPYVTAVDGSVAVSEIPGPVFGVVAKLVLKTGDALAPGDQVFLDPASGAFHVSATGTKAIGVYAGPAIASAVAGQEIEVLLGARHPGDTLRL